MKVAESSEVNWEARYLDQIDSRLESIERRQESLRTEIKAEMVVLRNEFKGELVGLRNELKADVRRLSTQMWGLSVGIVLTMMSVWLKGTF